MYKKKIVMLIALIAVIAGSFSLTGCEEENNEKVNVAMVISEKGTFDTNSFHIATWKGIKNYCAENNLTSKYYEPDNPTNDDYKKKIEEAVNDGAEIVLLPGYLLEQVAYEIQDDYKKTSFVLIDGVPNNAKEGDEYKEKIGERTYSLMYAEEQGGFLAGYAAVKDGYKKLGFFGGMSVPAVTRFGYGYLQGAEYAAKEMDLDKNSIEIKYIYAGSFVPDPKFQAVAEKWYYQGTEIIFACGGGIGYSVMKAAENSDAAVIGVDSDQSVDSDSVITSAIKIIDKSVYDALSYYYDGKFPGGEKVFLGTDTKGVGLPMETSKFRNFKQEDYDAIYDKLENDTENITTNIKKDDVTIEDIKLEHIKLVEE